MVYQITYGMNRTKSMKLEAGDGLPAKKFAEYILKKNGLVVDLLIICSTAALISAGADMIISINWGFLIAYSVGAFCVSHLMLEMVRDKIGGH